MVSTTEIDRTSPAISCMHVFKSNPQFSYNCHVFPAGTYECGFTNGSIRHTGRTYLSVALLPDTITLSTMPLTMNCSKGQLSVSLTASAIIPASNKTYDISWSYNGLATSYNAVQNTSKININFYP